MKYIKKYKNAELAINLVPGDWIKVGGVLYKVTSKIKHVQSVEINCHIESHPFNNFIMYVPDHMPFNVYYKDVVLKGMMGKTYLLAKTHRTGQIYMQEAQLDPRNTVIVWLEHQLEGLRLFKGDRVLFLDQVSERTLEMLEAINVLSQDPETKEYWRERKDGD